MYGGVVWRNLKSRYSAPLVVVSAASSNGRSGDQSVSLLTEMRDGGAGVIDSNSGVGGGVEDVYGEDSATEDQFITPWSLSVARYYYYLLY